MSDDFKWFVDDASDTIKDYARDFITSIIEPLEGMGFTRLEAIMVHMAFQQRHLRADVQDLAGDRDDGDTWKGDD